MLSQYALAEEYYSTAFHELTHSTMHEARCNRRSESSITRFGDSVYSREELVAEIGSAMISHRLGIEHEKAFQNSAAYIQSWLKALKNDKRMIIWAAKKAEEAARYILGEEKPLEQCRLFLNQNYPTPSFASLFTLEIPIPL